MNAITAITSNPKTNSGKESLTRKTCTPYVITQTPNRIARCQVQQELDGRSCDNSSGR